MKRLICLMVCIGLVLTMTAGCTAEQTNLKSTLSTTVSSDGTEPEDNEVTEPAGPDVDATEPTDPVDPDVEPEDPTDPVDPGVDPGTEPDTPVVPTEPDVEQDVTEPTTPSTPTEPTTPTEPVKPHTCSFTIKGKTVAATCIEKGYTVYSCSCGASQKQNYTNAKGHSYTKGKTVAATCEEKGYTVYSCSCGVSENRNFTEAKGHDYKQVADKITYPRPQSKRVLSYICQVCNDAYSDSHIATEEEIEAYYKAAAEAVVKYINEFRVAQGDTAATILPGLTQVAEYRAVQLTENFAHDTDDLREALAYYQYGKWLDATEWGLDESDSYWTIGGKEAIAETGVSSTADAFGKGVAKQFLGSPGHWSYVGSSEWTYIGVGVAHDSSGWFVCVLQTKVNYG